MKTMSRKATVVFFDAQMLLGNKTGIAYFSTKVIELLAESHPNTQFVGHYYNFLNRSQAELPRASNISYVSCSWLPVQLVNLLRRLRVEIPVELRVFKRCNLAIFPSFLSVPSFFHTPSISFIYDLTYLDHPEYMSLKNQRDLERFVPYTLRRSSYIFTISDFTKERLHHYYPELGKPVGVLPISPIEREAHLSNLTDSLLKQGLETDGYILYVGTVEPRKNISGLIKAYGLLPEKIRSHYALVLAGGKGWEDKAILETIEQAKRSGNNIIELGYVTTEEKNALYTNATCFVLPSHYEGFGMPIFEAMQLVTPVAISDIPVFHEVAGNAALYFNKDQAEDIAEKLGHLLSSAPLRLQLTTRAKKRLNRYNWNDTISLINNVFDSLLA